MSVCLDCLASPGKLCPHHAKTNNLHDESDECLFLVMSLRVALLDAQDPSHPKNCGTCTEALELSRKFLERQRVSA
jgi:hypothetical protein